VLSRRGFLGNLLAAAVTTVAAAYSPAALRAVVVPKPTPLTLYEAAQQWNPEDFNRVASLLAEHNPILDDIKWFKLATPMHVVSNGPAVLDDSEDW
jgi:hypothetical protein